MSQKSKRGLYKQRQDEKALRKNRARKRLPPKAKR